MNHRENRHSRIVMLWVLLALCGCGAATKPQPKAKPVPSKAVTKSISSVVETIAADEEPVDSAVAEPVPTVEASPVFRPDDQRPKFDDAALAVLGIQRYESKRLRLYTDIPADVARPLPAVIDAAYDALSEYFGALPPSRTGDEFQMTGYLMQDEKRFHEAGMIPDDLPPIEHGRHHRNQFWMREQQYDYYRRHLLIHEATHCVMMFLPENRAPVWYLEGMAELFGTHRTTADGKLQFDVMPTSPEEFAGFGRISLLPRAFIVNKGWSIAQVMEYPAEKYLNPEPYAWAWALCYFLEHHPRYAARFHELRRNQQPRAFAAAMEALLAEGGRDLTTEWVFFILNLQYGFDVPRAAITFEAGTPCIADKPRWMEIVANRGWQSTRCRLQAKQPYEITAVGQFTLAQQPKPWISEADGISYRYFRKIPLGKLLAWVRDEDGPAGGFNDAMLDVVPIGSHGEITSPVAGTLYLRLNDSWSELADNTGGVNISVRPIEK